MQKSQLNKEKLSMDYTTWAIPTEVEKAPETMVVASLYQALQKVPDRRHSQGKRYELALILCLIVLAKLAGQRTAVAEQRNGYGIAPFLSPSPLGSAIPTCRAR
jgi:hypothetical protein